MARKKKGHELGGIEIVDIKESKAEKKARKKREKQEKKGGLMNESAPPEAKPVVLEPETPETPAPNDAGHEVEQGAAVFDWPAQPETAPETELESLAEIFEGIASESNENQAEESIGIPKTEPESAVAVLDELLDTEISELFQQVEGTGQAESRPATETVTETLESLFGKSSADSTADKIEAAPLFEAAPEPPLEEEANEPVAAAEAKASTKPKKGRKSKSQPMFISLDDANAAELMGLKESPRKKKKKKREGPFGFKKIPTRLYVATICVLMAAVLGGSAMLFVSLRNLSNLHIPPEFEINEIILDNSVVAANAFNFIYADIPVPMDGIGQTIRRFSFDDSATIIYFTNEFDFTRYDIRLTDSFGHEAVLDALFIGYSGRAGFPERTVRFSPITAGSRGFTLNFTDNLSGEETELLFAFTRTHGLTAQRRFERLFTIRDADANVVGTVQSGAFTTTGSRFHFTLDRENRGYGLRFEPELGGSTVILRERGREINPLMPDGPATLYCLGGQLLLGRADFRPINHLTGVVELVFSRLFTELPVNQTVNAINFFYPDIIRMAPDPDRFVIFDVGDYRIILEFIIPHINNQLRLVFHAIDINAPVEDEHDRSNRREIMLYCQLVFTMATGERVVLNATNGLSSRVGSNVFFKPEDSAFAHQIAAGQFRSMELVVGEALIVLDDIVVRLDLDHIVHEDGVLLEQNLASHLNRINADRERYSVAVIAYERMGQNYRALVREVWHENGTYIVVTSEIYGFIDRFTMRLDENTEIYRSFGIY